MSAPPTADSATYVATVLMLYVDMPDTPLRATLQDHAVARALHHKGVPLSVVEAALLLASLRRLIRPANLAPLSRIHSLAYFQPVIAELQQQPLPNGYLDYLRLKLHNIANQPSAAVQKTTFSDDR